MKIVRFGEDNNLKAPAIRPIVNRSPYSMLIWSCFVCVELSGRSKIRVYFLNFATLFRMPLESLEWGTVRLNGSDLEIDQNIVLNCEYRRGAGSSS